MELPLHAHVGFEGGGAWEWAFAPDDACDAGRVPGGIGVRDHATNVVADDVDFASDAEVGMDEGDKVGGHGCLQKVAMVRVRGLPGSTIVWGDDAVAGGGERGDDVAKLVGSVGVGL